MTQPTPPSEDDLQATTRTLTWLAHLLDQTYQPEGVVLWFCARNRHLHDQRPVNLLLRGGRDGAAQVLNAAAMLDPGW